MPEPANDNWANAYSVQSAVQSGQQITGYTLAATTEAGEPAGTNTVWFQYDCYQAGVLAIYPSGGNISLWQGSSVSNLAQVPAYYTTPMDPRWTDINYYNVAMSMGSQPNPGFNTNGIDFNLTQPGTYYIRRSGPPVVYSDEMEFHLRPINDNFQTPINLPLSSTIGSTAQIQLDTFSYTYTSEGAHLQNGEPASPLGPGDRLVSLAGSRERSIQRWSNPDPANVQSRSRSVALPVPDRHVPREFPQRIATGSQLVYQFTGYC